jgi:hypothetical protein
MRGGIRLFVATVSVAALGLVASLVSVSAAAGPNTVRIHVVERATTDTVIDTDDDGLDSTGDLLTFHNELFDETNTNLVGTDQGDCIRIEAGASWECRWVSFLEGGSITVEGPFLDTGPSTLAITGGTGAYKGARGAMRLLFHNDAGTEFDFIYKVILD